MGITKFTPIESNLKHSTRRLLTLFHPSFFAHAKCCTVVGPFRNKIKRETDLSAEYSILKTRAQDEVYKPPSGSKFVFLPLSKQGGLSKVRRVMSYAAELAWKISPRLKSLGRNNGGNLLRGSLQRETNPKELSPQRLFREDYVREWH